MLLEVYDIETLSNLFTYTGFDATNKKWYQTIVCYHFLLKLKT
jgi:hypothetical protein